MKTLSASVIAALTFAGCAASTAERGPDLEDRAARALERVSLRLGAARLLTAPLPRAPLAEAGLRLEDEDGPFELGLREHAGRLELVLLEEGGAEVVAADVRPLAAGEVANGMDDNGNGLIDEPGFSVVRDLDGLKLRLTLARADGAGERVASAETNVALRR